MKRYISLLLLIIIAFIFAGVMWWDSHRIPQEARHTPQQNDSTSKLHDEMLYATPAPHLTFVPPTPETSFQLIDFKGSIVILNFWASWCPPCLEEIPSFITLLNTAQTRHIPLQLIAINNDASERVMLDFIQSYNAQNTPHFDHPLMHVVYDHDHHFTQDIFHTLRYPETIIIAPNGMMVRKIIGGDFNWNSSEVIAYFETLARMKSSPSKSH